MNENIAQVIERCRSSVIFFIENFCQVKHPTAGVIPFRLFSYQKRSLAAFHKHRMCCYRKVRQCFSGESMVWTPRGPKRIDSIQIGDEVYALDDRLKAVKVSEVHDNGTASCIEVRTKSGHKSIVTSDHLFLTRRGWKAAKELSLDDVIIEVNDISNYNHVDVSEAALLGYLLTDGYCGSKMVHFTNTRLKYILDFRKWFERKFGDTLKYVEHRNSGFGSTKRTFRIWSYSKQCLGWLRSLGILGLTKKDKKIPDAVFGWDNESIAILLNRMFAGDGWYSGTRMNEIGIGSISLILLHQIKQLLSRFNIDGVIYENKSSIAKLRICGGPNSERFIKQIGIFGKEPRRPITKGFIFNRVKGQVKSIREIGDRKVYDLTVPPHHNYVVDGAIVHNCGISTLAGAYALWSTMFFKNRTTLITSKRDLDAKEFLAKNVRLVYNKLPEWLKSIFPTSSDSMHEFCVGPTGSKITSLPGGPNTLRSNSSSLNIIDEAAFTPHMEEMWAAGAPTISHGGQVIVISTCNGVGGWYWNTWMDAEANMNDFHPLEVMWWDMDWVIEYVDQITGRSVRICPRDGIRKTTKEEEPIYGPYWSPWLEEQYRALRSRGESHLFPQEILAEFLGSGSTVVPVQQIKVVGTQVKESPPYKVVSTVPYENRAAGIKTDLHFMNDLWVWKKPIYGERGLISISGKPLSQEKRGHTYLLGADPSTGDKKDYSGIQVIDVDAREQVAELMTKADAVTFSMMVDYVGRWYNNATVVVDNIGYGYAVIQELRDRLQYPNLWREIRGQHQVKDYGYVLSPQGKAILNKSLIAAVGMDLIIHSHRLFKQITTYVHLKANKTGAEPGIGNYDDLVLALGCAMVAVESVVGGDPMMFVESDGTGPVLTDPTLVVEQVLAGSRDAMLPLVSGGEDLPPVENELLKFTQQLTGRRGVDEFFVG